MNTRLAVSAALRKLAEAGVAAPARDARLLLAHALGLAPDRLTVDQPDTLEPAQAALFEDLIARRAAREPVSHILGRRAFFGRMFEVTPDVLDPRGDTETLIDAALAVPFADVLDLGTGSGCILVTLLAERSEAVGIGVDISDEALRVACRNAVAIGVQDRCAIKVSDWFDAVAGTYDLIVSNPPYIALDEMAGLAAEVLHEPRIALTDEGCGLSCYRNIAAGAGIYLNAGGWLMVECGPTQGAAVAGLFRGAGLVDVTVRSDLDGRDRVVSGQKPR